MGYKRYLLLVVCLYSSTLAKHTEGKKDKEQITNNQPARSYSHYL